jgi:hypothetical protein
MQNKKTRSYIHITIKRFGHYVRQDSAKTCWAGNISKPGAAFVITFFSFNSDCPSCINDPPCVYCKKLYLPSESFLFHMYHSLTRLIYFSGAWWFGREVWWRGELEVRAELVPTMFKMYLSLFHLGLTHRSGLLDARIYKSLVVGVQKRHRKE